MRGRRGSRRGRLRSGDWREIWRRIDAGEPTAAIAAAVGCSPSTIAELLRRTGGVHPPPSRGPRAQSPSGRRLSFVEREEISRGLRAGESLRRIAARLGRVPSTISREVARNDGRRGYRAWRAAVATQGRAGRPRLGKLARDARLREAVERLLLERWSPEQISQRLVRDHPDDGEMRVSHETIYRSLFIQGRGALRRELTACLRSGRVQRRRRGQRTGVGEISGMVLISERPAEVADRAVPGHWEGDLLIGRGGRSAIGTLVERQTRYVLLVALPAGRSAELVRDAVAERILTLPEQLRRSLTWDRGKEMAEHSRFTVSTGVQVYFCDPHSPWQRGTNENTNGLLRQYLPRGMDLATLTQAQLDDVARELNGRPRQTLDWLKPSEALARVVASTS
jgi:transposase, IS30 family